MFGTGFETGLRTGWTGMLAALAGMCACPAVVYGQANFAEEFEGIGSVAAGQQGPQGLIAKGWLFRNQSEPLGGSPAWSANGGVGWPFSGSGYLRSTSSSAGQFGAKVSNWAILPPVPGQVSGDEINLWVLDGGYGSTPTYIDIRYSPTGGTGTGSGAFDVGDFTHVLFTGELPISAGPMIYTKASAVVPGPGRIAVRFHAPAVSNFQSSATLYLDTLTVGPAQGPPCGLQLPGPGQTVTWSGSATPYVVCQDLVIPEDATLILGAGAKVDVMPGRDLIVNGTLLAQGTSAQPVIITGDSVSGLWVKGRVELHHADLTANVYMFDGATTEAFDSIFRETANISSAQPRTFARLERCEVRSEGATFARHTVLTDVSITNPQTFVSLLGFWRIEGLESVAPLTFIASLQDRLVDHVSVTGVAGAPALELHGNGGVVDFRLGEHNTLTGNGYPVWARFAGLTPDSVVPGAGNTQNAVLGPVNASADLRSRVSLPNLGVPYHFLERGVVRGDVRVGPGTVMRFGPLGGLTVGGDNGTDGWLRGLPGQPITLERLDPGQPWFSLATYPGWVIFEHLLVKGAGVGVVGNESELWLRDSVIRDCEFGAHPAADGNIYGSGVEFYNNQLALRDDVSNPAAQIKTGIHFSGVERPNIFEGNVLAAKNFGTTTGHKHPFPVDHNWWGHETGPYEPLFHPQGQGDEVSPFVEFQPFLTARPDLSDARPVVRLKTRVHPVVHPGEKIIVEWDAFDDGAIQSFDVVMLDPDLNLPAGFFFVTLGEDLPGSTRAFEVVLPDVGLHPYERFPVRIIATDDAGNTGFEQFWVSIPHQKPSAQVAFHTPLVEFGGGEQVKVCYDAIGLNTSPTVYVETAADDRVAMEAAGPSGLNACTYSTVEIPFASTNRARLAIRAQGNWNRDEWYFTEYFTIRPDERLGDAPPQIEMTLPAAGAQYSGGGVVPIRWNASDDGGIREFRVQASFNGGYTFHTIAPSVAASATGYDWQLPASTGIDDVRVRVVAVDTMMQNTAAGDERVFQILPGSVAACYANCDGSTGAPVLNVADFGCFLNRFASGDPYANCDGSTSSPVLNVADFGCFLNKFAAGCP